ncbi:MAG: gliding motility-associated C-terminal domain-containing protein [Flavihumibacter sp.]|nr:gliding motility-associated C-terminal domain-containing protein [Flavihumibacter sp.]
MAAFFTAVPLSAQLCTGSLGDPLAIKNFGSGSNPGQSLAPGVTTYSYTISGCPPDGSYTIYSSAGSCFNDSWHVLTEDHTPGDVNGYMMAVNAALTPGVFYLDTVKGLCGTTLYEFSAWVLNILKPTACNGAGTRPNLSFSIETTAGVVLQSYNTGDINSTATPVWNQYGFFVSLPPGVTDVVLRLTNNAPGGCGNDLVLDDIAFRPCGPKLDALFANVTGNNGTVNYCIVSSQSVSFTANLQSGYTNPAYQWQVSADGVLWNDIVGATTANYTRAFNVAGTFRYRITAAEAANIASTKCRVVSNVLTVIIDSVPKPAAASNGPVCEGGVINLTAKDGVTYQWTGPNGYTATGTPAVINAAQINQSGKYYVLVTTAGGCTNTDSVPVAINPNPIAAAGADEIICDNESVVLSGSGGTAYDWQPTTGLSNGSVPNPVAAPKLTTTYILRVLNSFGCGDTDTVTVTVLTAPTADAGPDLTIIEGTAVKINAQATGGTLTYLWSPPLYIDNPGILTPTVAPPDNLVYRLSVISANGCGAAEDEVAVRVFKKLIVPNAFSPNGDGINDKWMIEAIGSYPEVVVEIFNRYGQKLFRSVGYTRPWDGTLNGQLLPIGTYYYLIDRKNGLPQLSGSVTILR